MQKLIFISDERWSIYVRYTPSLPGVSCPLDKPLIVCLSCFVFCCNIIMATVLVTGANRGIGYAIVQAIGTRFPASTVLLGCRTTDAGEQAIEELKTGGIRANLHAIQIDIEDDDSIAASAASVRERFGKLDGGCCSPPIIYAITNRSSFDQ